LIVVFESSFLKLRVARVGAYVGSLDDPAIDDLRALRSIWVASDAVAVRRGRYSDLLDVAFAIKAATKDEALQRAYDAIQSASRKTSG
jgi:hypothetical protein